MYIDRGSAVLLVEAQAIVDDSHSRTAGIILLSGFFFHFPSFFFRFHFAHHSLLAWS